MTIFWRLSFLKPIRMVARSKAWVCDRWFAGIAGSNPAGGLHLSLLQMLCVVQVEVYTSGRSFVQGSPTECVCVSLLVIRCNTNPLHLQ